MAHLVYAEHSEYEFDERTLVHVKTAVGAKLRRGECFYLSWDTKDDDSGRVTLWISPTIPLQFHFDESEPPALDREWLEELSLTSHSLRGMVVDAPRGARARRHGADAVESDVEQASGSAAAADGMSLTR
ncbi:hypothetical protein GCM10027416_03310 [Okibacterium endophyticum]